MQNGPPFSRRRSSNSPSPYSIPTIGYSRESSANPRNQPNNRPARCVNMTAGQRVEELEFQDGTIRSRTGNVGELLMDVLARGAAEGLEAEGESAATQHQSLTASSMGYGAVFVEVGVDAQLGEIRVRRVCGAFAAGHILNPLLAKSQYVGGLIGGIGMALHERTTTDLASGQIVSDSFADYLIPVHADIPEFDI